MAHFQPCCLMDLGGQGANEYTQNGDGGECGADASIWLRLWMRSKALIYGGRLHFQLHLLYAHTTLIVDDIRVQAQRVLQSHPIDSTTYTTHTYTTH